MGCSMDILNTIFNRSNLKEKLFPFFCYLMSPPFDLGADLVYYDGTDCEQSEEYAKQLGIILSDFSYYKKL